MVRRTVQGLAFGLLLVAAVAQAESNYDRVNRELTPQERAKFVQLDTTKRTTFFLEEFSHRLREKYGNLEYHGRLNPELKAPAVKAPAVVSTGTSAGQSAPSGQTPVVVQPDHGVATAPGGAPGGTPPTVTTGAPGAPVNQVGAGTPDSTGAPVVVNGQKAIAAVDSTQNKAVVAVDSTQLKAVAGVADQSKAAPVSAAVAATVTEDEVHQYHQNAVWFFGAARSVKNSNDITACVLRLKTDIRPKLSAADQKQLDPRVSFFLDHRTQPTTFRGKRAAFGADACEIYEKKILKAMGLVK